MDCRVVSIICDVQNQKTDRVRMTKLNHKFSDDGNFYISYEDLLRKYQVFDQTRIFTAEWKVAQEWATLKVSWIIDYHDTKFQISLKDRTSVVIVFSQLDDRYFKGLQGQYRFELAFRVHKAGDSAYIVRSQTSYCMNRSVSAELELDAGVYDILLKVKADRNSTVFAPQRVVRENCKNKREKLVRIGMSYDMAHSKGQAEETKEEKKSREAAEAKAAAKEKGAMREKLTEEKKEARRHDVRKIRRQRTREAKRKAKAEARAAKRKASQAVVEQKIPTSGSSVAATNVTVTEEKSPSKEGSNDKNESHSADTGTENHPISGKSGKLDSPKVEIPVRTRTPVAKGSSESEALSPTATKSKANIPALIVEEKSRESVQDGNSVSASLPADSLFESAGQNTASTAEPGFKAPSIYDDSDTDTDVSSVASSVVDLMLARSKEAAEELSPAAPQPPPAPGVTVEEEEQDEFEKDPWNAFAVVGLRVYSLNAAVELKVVRPREWEVAGDEREGTGLDIDDSAMDATIPEGEADSGGMGFRGSVGSVKDGMAPEAAPKLSK
jgi:hypothetical protein